MTKSQSQFDGLHVLLGVAGGISAFKAVDLASKLTGNGAEVHTIMTASACELIRPRSFEAVTNGAVFTSMWTQPQEHKIGHVSLSGWADVIVVAPATANIISKAANGICDDLLSTTLCVCWQKPLVLAPAMNTRMWENPAVQANVAKLREMGYELVGPEQGRLACGDIGAGRMSEPMDIMNAVALAASKK